jgi:NADH-quinone oxidoreductase subunit D
MAFVEEVVKPGEEKKRDTTGATLAGFRNARALVPDAEDMLIPGVEDVVAASTGHHKPHGADPVNDQTMVLNMGPQHPSTHGVLRLVIELDGETTVSLAPDIGYLHTGIEKTCEAKFYAQVTPLTDRIDYLCPMTNNTAYALAVEKLLQLEISERAQWLRVLFNELTRIQSHLVWLGTHAMDIGALTVFLYCFREREDLLRIFEAVSGQRMMTSYIRIGGVSLDMPLDLYARISADVPGQDCRVRRPAAQQSHLARTPDGHWASFRRGCHCAGYYRAALACLGC